MNIEIKRYQDIRVTSTLESFKKLNREWILQCYGKTPENDHRALNNPKKEIIDNGGQILFAITCNTPIGTVALIPFKGGLELAKLAVDPSYRRLGVASQLVKNALTKAKALGYQEVFLYTNKNKLPNAFSLYQKLGFKVTDNNSENPRCETKMIKKL